jgi:LAS superfamily LD-carboxypeptidase LdcB
MQSNGLGGSNWQGVDDGWGRNPGLADSLVNYLEGRSGSSAPDQARPASAQQPSGGDTRYGHRRYEQAQYVSDVGTYNGRTEQLERETANAFKRMQQDAAAAGVDLAVISGFRTYKEQEDLWRNQVRRQGSPEAAARISAPPGYSEHHTGRTLDIGDRNAPNTDTQVSFEQTEAYRWMQANGGNYGFEQSFGKGSTQGAGYEPWHWRFAGNQESARIFGRPQLGGQQQASGQVRSLSGAGSTGGGTGLDSGEVAEADFDPSPYLEPSQKAQRDLEATRARLRREGQVLAQERQESDRALALEREKRAAELEVQITALAPEDTVGKMLLEFEQNALAIEESVGDRRREADRALEDLNRAREEKIRALEALDLKRKAFDDQMARGQDTAGVTQETLKKEEADISPIDYSAAIAEYEKYKESLQELIDPKLEAQRNTLLNQMDQEIEKAEKLVRATTALNNQYGNTGDYAKYQAQVEGITVAYDEQGKALDNAVKAMAQLSAVKGLTEEEQIAIITQQVAAQTALNGLVDGYARSLEEAARQYERLIQAGQDKTVDTLMQSRLKLIEAQAKAMQRFDSQGATDMRRRAADMDLAIDAQRTLVQLRNDEVEAVRLLEQAIAIGDEAYVRSQSEIGRGTVEGIHAQVSQLEDNARDSLVLQAEAIAEQFPTIAEAFEASMADAFQGGVNSGLMQLTEDGDIFGALGTVFNSLFDSVLKQGASKASEWLTGQMFGAGEGWLSNLFPDGDSPILTDSEEAAIVLENSAIAAGEHILDAAIEAGAILDAAGQSTAAAERGPIGMETLPQIWTGRTKEPPKPAAFEELGITLGRTFSRAMPEAGRHLAQPFATTMPSLINRLFDGFSSGGGSSRILDLVGGVLKLFSGGGYVENFAGGGIAAAMQRERAQSGGANPRMAIVNDKEFIIKGSATQALTKKYGSSFLNGLNEGRIEAYAGGGFASRINPVVPSGGYGAAQQVPQARNSTIRADFKTVRIGNMDFVSADQFNQLQDQINQKASASESAQATFDLMRNYPDVRNRLRLD